MKVKTPANLKAMHLINNPTSLYFDRGTMKAFGDTMANYGVWEHAACYELYRKAGVKDNMTSSTFFDKETFKRLHGDLIMYREAYLLADRNVLKCTVTVELEAHRNANFYPVEYFKQLLEAGELPSHSYTFAHSDMDIHACTSILDQRK